MQRIRVKPIKKLPEDKIAKFKQLRKLWDIIKFRKIEQVESIIIHYTGVRGTGKSLSAISDAIQIDPDFTVDQICFTRLEVDQALDNLSWTGGPRIIVYDETGATLNAREWYEKEQIRLTAKLQIVRDTGVSVFCVLPHLRFGDSAIDLIANLGIEMTEPKHKDDCYRLGKALKTWGLYSKRGSIEFNPLWMDGKIFHVPFLDPKPDNPALYEQYLVKKREFIKTWQKQQQQQETISITARQVEYIQAFNEGLSNAQIAKKFGVRVDTVKKNKQQLRLKGLLPMVE